MRTWLFALIVVTLQAPTAAAQPPSQPRDQAKGAQASSAQERPAPEGQLPVSIDRIRKELEENPPGSEPALRIGELPTFRVTVYGQRKPLLPDFTETLKQEWQPVVPGGIHNKEIMDMITPPQARAFGAFTGGGLAEVAGTALINALIQRALITGFHAVTGRVHDWRQERIRREVAAELAAFLLANPQPPPEKNEKKGGEPDR